MATSFFPELRLLAEQRVGMLADDFDDLQDLPASLQELRVYKAELEIQNEELVDARSLVEASQRKYFRHFDLAPVGLLRLSPDAVILETNILAAQMLGICGDSFGPRSRRFLLNVAPQSHPDFQRHLEDALHSTKMELCELWLRDLDGAETFVRMQSVRSHGELGVAELYVTLTDLSEHRALENLLAQQQTELRQEVAARARLESEILAVSEREQSRIGMELHDGVSQQLAGIALLARTLADKLLAEGHTAAGMASDLARFSQESIEVTRELARGLYPVDLEREGLLVALEDLANETQQRFQVHCALHAAGRIPRLEKAAEIHLYRIVQESIANAIQHGRAQSVFIESSTLNGIYTLSITDDGTGTSRPAAPPSESPSESPSGMGLRLMEYRARLIKADLAIERAGAGGWKVSLGMRPRGA